MMRRICYLLLLAAGFFQMMLYDYQGLRFLLCCAVCIPAMCFILLLFQVFSCKVTLLTDQTFVSRGDTVKARAGRGQRASSDLRNICMGKLESAR